MIFGADVHDPKGCRRKALCEKMVALIFGPYTKLRADFVLIMRMHGLDSAWTWPTLLAENARLDLK